MHSLREIIRLNNGEQAYVDEIIRRQREKTARQERADDLANRQRIARENYAA